jgi:predicted NBD/HSP70 family sugar kinase
MKRMNMEKILKLIISQQPISRAKISALTDLHKVTVSNCVNYLLEKGLVQEFEISTTSRGRPPIMVRIDGNSGICIGIDVDTNECHVLVTDLSGRRLEQSTFPLSRNEPEFFIHSVSALVANVKDKYPHYKLGIVGIGIAICGYYNQTTESIEYIANMQSWNQFPLKKELIKSIPGIPFFIDTSAAAGAFGEIHFGGLSASEQFVYIGGRRGLVVSAYADGKIFRGHNGFTGRIGHATIHMNGKKCSCGNKGCWEAYASVVALYELIDSAAMANQPLVPFSYILERIEQHDPAYLSAVYEVGRYLGIGLVNVINAYYPRTICIGGYLGMIGAPLLNTVSAVLEERIPNYIARDISLYGSKLGEDGAAYGAISLVMEHLPEMFVDAANNDS